MNQEQENPYPKNSLVWVRYPDTPPGPEGYGTSRDWPWLPGQIVERCGEDEWHVMVVDKRFATLEDGSEAPHGTDTAKLFYPMVFRNGEELMIMLDDGSTPDGPVVHKGPEHRDSMGRARLAENVGLLVMRLTEVRTMVKMWAGVDRWASMDESGRDTVGQPALFTLVIILTQLCDLSIRLHHSGCASNHYNYDNLAAARELLLLSVQHDQADTDAAAGEPAHRGTSTVERGSAGAAAGAGGQLGAAAGQPASDETWMSYYDAVMNFAQPTSIEAPPTVAE